MRSSSVQGWEQVACILDQVMKKLRRIDVPAENDECSLSLYFESTEIPDISVLEYLARFRTYTECSDSCFILAFIYIDRVLKRNPPFELSARKIHRLVLAAILVAIKYLDDSYAKSEDYAFLGGVSTEEVNFLEVALISLLQFELCVHPEVYYRYTQEIGLQFQKLKEGEIRMEVMEDKIGYKSIREK
eukprot:TRINITY_DN9687_c0_g10_i1.p1 TRINITY_DN9687_c0_g10~~TRINITY_DN9687_c0_g10_i1.p1  ORF type:complete len:188 (-),score=17.65 TRINITY_DN9687_c0_g10_i1:150-713(-)